MANRSKSSGTTRSRSRARGRPSDDEETGCRPSPAVPPLGVTHLEQVVREGKLPELANGLLNLAHQHSDRPSDELTALIAAALFEIANGARDDELRSGRTLFAAAAIAIFEALQKRDPEVQ